MLKDMASNQNSLLNGYNILSQYEKRKKFYIGMLEIIFSHLNDKILTKLCCSSFKIFIQKNWSDENFIDCNERLVN